LSISIKAEVAVYFYTVGVTLGGGDSGLIHASHTDVAVHSWRRNAVFLEGMLNYIFVSTVNEAYISVAMVFSFLGMAVQFKC